MTKSMSQLYIDEIVNSLISRHAAVLVGAGFSRNADPANETVKTKMPMWNGLIDQFCEKLGIEDRKYLNTLTVAQELEESYSRPFLDDMIRKTMSDDDYEPSDIHVNLMSLPWSDVFTTNYDTLLERACAKITDRQYQIIRDQKDLIYSAGKPRLIKLHGSFPSNGPFVITEEDFRKYPHDRAPFVNTVQQALLENTFCLIGFSGDDPNFLKWIGWIHDNLGLTNSPMIYLITHEAFPKPKENSLLAKKIKVVVLEDIDKYKDTTILPDKDEYRKELYRRFIKDLVERIKEGEKKHTEWPSFGSYGLHNEIPSVKRIRDILKKIHDSYPGWIIAPFKLHERISGFVGSLELLYSDRKSFKKNKGFTTPDQTKKIKQAVEEDEKLSDSEKVKQCLEIAYEYCWLNNIIGRPILTGYVKDVQSFAEKYEVLPLEERNRTLEQKLHYIYLTLLRSYRINGDSDKWDSLFKKIEDARLTTDEKNSLLYEDIYHDIYELRFSELNKKINKIDADNNQTIWMLRKASLLAIIGKYTEAQSLLQQAINFIRYAGSGKLMVNGVRSRSIESCMVTLYNYVVQAHKTAREDFESHENDFLDEAKKDLEFDFVWHQENRQYAGLLTDEYYYKPQTVTTHNYGIGSVSYSTSFGQSDAKDILTAYEFLTFREVTGIPYRLSYVVNKNGVLGTAKRLARYNIIYPIVLAVLTQDDKIIKNVWSRNYVSRISTENIDELVDICVKAFDFSLSGYLASEKNFFNNSVMEFPLYIMPEVLARLCSRCSSEKFNDLLHVISSMYEADQKKRMPDAGELVRRFIECIPLDQLITGIDVFLRIPLNTDNVYSDSRYPECLELIYSRLNKVWLQDRKGADDEIEDEGHSDSHNNDSSFRIPLNEFRKDSLSQLFKLSRDKEYHHTAINRLLYASQIFQFSDEEQKNFESLILSPNNVKNGRPYLGRFLPSSIKLFVKKGKPDLRPAEEEWNNIMESIKKDSAPGEYTDYSWDENSAIAFVQNHLLSEEQVNELADVLLSFCKKLADTIADDSSFGGFIDYSAKSNIKSAAYLIGEAILSAHLADADKAYQSEKVNSLHELFMAADIPCSLLDYCMDREQRENHYLQNLFHGKKDYAADAANGLYSFDRYGIPIGETTKTALLGSIISAMSVEVVPYVRATEFITRRGLYTDEQMEQLDKALPKFLDITAVDETDTDDIVSEKLVLRKWVSMLAHSLYRIEIRKDLSITEGVAHWKKINAEQEEYAEIRNSWDEFPEQSEMT